ncbi:proline-rich protein 36-like isoform X2 [Lepisosteus oculatus]|uniref:proline-rich protein 36-like isoform X2 n=1 Tax=Lepisosteus oculatus TaxID=7918 RepID=UPI003718BA30
MASRDVKHREGVRPLAGTEVADFLLDQPLGSKTPIVPGVRTTFYTTSLCERLHQDSADFVLTDPSGRLLHSTYNSLHDPNLKQFFSQRDRQRLLVRQGLLTPQKKVICTTKEFNQYREYLTTVKLDWEKSFLREQKELVRKFLVLQEKKQIPPGITVCHLREWLLDCGSAARIWRGRNGRTENQNTHSYSELAWRERLRQQLQELEVEVHRELRLERRWDKKKAPKQDMRLAAVPEEARVHSEAVSQTETHRSSALPSRATETSSSPGETSCPSEPSQKSQSTHLTHLKTSIEEQLRQRVSAEGLGPVLGGLVRWVVTAVSDILIPAIQEFEESPGCPSDTSLQCCASDPGSRCELSPPRGASGPGSRRELSPPRGASGSGSRRELSPPRGASGSGSRCELGPPHGASGSGSRCELGPPHGASGSGSRCELGPPHGASGSGSRCELGPPHGASGSGSRCELGPPRSASGSGSRCELGPPHSASGSGSRREISPPRSASDPGSRRELSPPRGASGSGSRCELSPPHSTSPGGSANGGAPPPSPPSPASSRPSVASLPGNMATPEAAEDAPMEVDPQEGPPCGAEEGEDLAGSPAGPPLPPRPPSSPLVKEAGVLVWDVMYKAVDIVKHLQASASESAAAAFTVSSAEVRPLSPPNPQCPLSPPSPQCPPNPLSPSLTRRAESLVWGVVCRAVETLQLLQAEAQEDTVTFDLPCLLDTPEPPTSSQAPRCRSVESQACADSSACRLLGGSGERSEEEAELGSLAQEIVGVILRSVAEETQEEEALQLELQASAPDSRPPPAPAPGEGRAVSPAPTGRCPESDPSSSSSSSSLPEEDASELSLQTRELVSAVFRGIQSQLAKEELQRAGSGRGARLSEESLLAREIVASALARLEERPPAGPAPRPASAARSHLAVGGPGRLGGLLDALRSRLQQSTVQPVRRIIERLLPPPPPPGPPAASSHCSLASDIVAAVLQGLAAAAAPGSEEGEQEVRGLLRAAACDRLASGRSLQPAEVQAVSRGLVQAVVARLKAYVSQEALSMSTSESTSESLYPSESPSQFSSRTSSAELDSSSPDSLELMAACTAGPAPQQGQACDPQRVVSRILRAVRAARGGQAPLTVEQLSTTITDVLFSSLCLDSPPARARRAPPASVPVSPSATSLRSAAGAGLLPEPPGEPGEPGRGRCRRISPEPCAPQRSRDGRPEDGAPAEACRSAPALAPPRAPALSEPGARLLRGVLEKFVGKLLAQCLGFPEALSRQLDRKSAPAASERKGRLQSFWRKLSGSVAPLAERRVWPDSQHHDGMLAALCSLLVSMVMSAVVPADTPPAQHRRGAPDAGARRRPEGRSRCTAERTARPGASLQDLPGTGEVRALVPLEASAPLPRAASRPSGDESAAPSELSRLQQAAGTPVIRASSLADLPIPVCSSSSSSSSVTSSSVTSSSVTSSSVTSSSVTSSSVTSSSCSGLSYIVEDIVTGLLETVAPASTPPDGAGPARELDRPASALSHMAAGLVASVLQVSAGTRARRPPTAGAREAASAAAHTRTAVEAQEERPGDTPVGRGEALLRRVRRGFNILAACLGRACCFRPRVAQEIK